MIVHIHTEQGKSTVACMSLAEFMQRLDLPARPVTVDIDWGDVDLPGVTIYLEREKPCR
jgi:hypothetical protein